METSDTTSKPQASRAVNNDGPSSTVPGEPRGVSTRTDPRHRHHSNITLIKQSSSHIFSVSGSTLHFLKSTLSPQAYHSLAAGDGIPSPPPEAQGGRPFT